MDPSSKSGGALHRLHCFCLEFDGACEVQCRVPTDWIIELDSRLAQFIPGIRIRSAQRMAFIGEVIFTGR